MKPPGRKSRAGLLREIERLKARNERLEAALEDILRAPERAWEYADDALAPTRKCAYCKQASELIFRGENGKPYCCSGCASMDKDDG